MSSSEIIQATITITALLLVIPLYLVAMRRGLLRSDSFDAAPTRTGELTWADMLGGLALWFFGQIIGQLMAMQWFGIQIGQPLTARESLIAIAGASLGTIPAIVFCCVRANVSMAGGLRAWGLHPSHLFDAPWRGLVSLGFTLPFLLTLSTITMALLLLVGITPPSVAHSALEAILNESGTVRIGFIFIAVVAAPFIEEVIFRGWLQTTLRTSGLVRSRWAAIMVTTTVFTLIHVNASHPASLVSLPAIYILSIGLGWLYERYGNLWACIFMHMFFNATQVALALGLFQDTPATGLQ